MLDPVKHERLIGDMERVCSVANIPPKFLKASMLGVCGSVEVEWVRNFHKNVEDNVGGLVLLGGGQSHERVMSIGAALLRNFIDARAMTLSDGLLDGKRVESYQEPTVLLVDRLYHKSQKIPFTNWQVHAIFDMLSARHSANRPTVMFIEEMQSLEKVVGTQNIEFLKNNYKTSANS